MVQRIFCSAIVGTMLLAAAGEKPAGATGYWNMPSTFCQRMGCGFGAGHHADFILGPISCDGWCATKERRLPYPPSVPCGWNGYGNCRGEFGQPTMMAPAPQPPAPAVVPMSQPHRPLFLR